MNWKDQATLCFMSKDTQVIYPATTANSTEKHSSHLEYTPRKQSLLRYTEYYSIFP